MKDFETGDLVILMSDCYVNLPKGTAGIVVDSTHCSEELMNVWVDGQAWLFKRSEFTHPKNYKEGTCTQ